MTTSTAALRRSARRLADRVHDALALQRELDHRRLGTLPAGSVGR